jgi:hypothetical protein
MHALGRQAAKLRYLGLGLVQFYLRPKIPLDLVDPLGLAPQSPSGGPLFEPDFRTGRGRQRENLRGQRGRWTAPRPTTEGEPLDPKHGV